MTWVYNIKIESLVLELFSKDCNYHLENIINLLQGSTYFYYEYIFEITKIYLDSNLMN